MIIIIITTFLFICQYHNWLCIYDLTSFDLRQSHISYIFISLIIMITLLFYFAKLLYIQNLFPYLTIKVYWSYEMLFETFSFFLYLKVYVMHFLLFLFNNFLSAFFRLNLCSFVFVGHFDHQFCWWRRLR